MLIAKRHSYSSFRLVGHSPTTLFCELSTILCTDLMIEDWRWKTKAKSAVGLLIWFKMFSHIHRWRVRERDAFFPGLLFGKWSQLGRKRVASLRYLLPQWPRCPVAMSVLSNSAALLGKAVAAECLSSSLCSLQQALLQVGCSMVLQVGGPYLYSHHSP